jgi:hypothetical protein
LAKKKKRRRPAAGRPARGLAEQPVKSPQRGVSETAAMRRERKEQARQARQAALRQYRRRRVARRGLVWGGAGLAVVLVLFLVQRSGPTGSGTLSKLGTSTAQAAGCTALQKPPDQGRTHLPSGGSYTYQQQPPTSGPHDPTPLPGGVYTQPQSETNVVHSLEHGAVEFSYESSGAGALPSDVVSALKSVAGTNGRVIMTPAPQALSAPLDGKTFTVSLAFAAWDRLVQCPSTITSAQAKTLAQAFVKAFVNAGSAPEHGLPL